MRILPVFIVCVFLLLPAVSAFGVNIDVVNNTVLPFESATYRLTFESDAGADEVVTLHTNSNNWILTPQTVVVKVNESTVKDLIITPRSNVGISNYRIPLIFESEQTGQTVSDSVFMSISLDLLTKGYPINVRSNITAPASFDPREPYTVKVFLKNNNLRDINNLSVSIHSDLFSEEVTTGLEPLSAYRKEFIFDVDSLLPPGRHELTVTVSVPGEDMVIASESQYFDVTGYARVDTGREMVSNVFFRSKEVITLFNDGNEPRTKKLTYAVSWWEDLFASSVPEGVVGEVNDVRSWSWDVSLDAQASEVIVVVHDYRVLFYLALLVVLLVAAYFLFRSPVIIMKEAQVTGMDEEGSSEMKVRVYVKNRSRRAVHNLKVIDRVPRIAELITHAHLGTLQPTKVTKSEKRGTIVRWELESLEPYEERIISYKIRSKLKIVGSMSLPESKIKFEVTAGRERVTGSGATQFSE